jgi:hypothetical protein
VADNYTTDKASGGQTGQVNRIEYQPRALQIELHNLMDVHRFGIYVCHRRFGKTTCAIIQLIFDAVSINKPQPRTAYIAPTYKRAKAIAWDFAKRYASSIPLHKINETELRIDFPQNDGRFRLFGVDYPEALKGIYLDEAVLDEFDEMSSSVFTEVVRPALADRKGKCFMSGTPRGKGNLHKFSQIAESDPDWFARIYKASETGIIEAEELESLKRSMSEDEYNQELECSYLAGIAGAYWRNEMKTCRDGGRICAVPFDPALLVNTYWDLGRGVENTMVVWFGQEVSDKEKHFIDHYECSGEGFPHFAEMLSKRSKDLGYKYGKHFAPHDIQVHELGTNNTRLQQASALGINFFPIPRVEHKSDSIEAARKLINVSWFDKDKCSKGIDHLEQYRRDWDNIGGVWHTTPVHNVHSNSADAFQQAAMAINIPTENQLADITGQSTWKTKRGKF